MDHRKLSKSLSEKTQNRLRAAKLEGIGMTELCERFALSREQIREFFGYVRKSKRDKIARGGKKNEKTE